LGSGKEVRKGLDEKKEGRFDIITLKHSARKREVNSDRQIGGQENDPKGTGVEEEGRS